MSSRREFLTVTLGSSGLVCLATAAPKFLLRAAELKPANDRENVLVVVQLTGGNDGLNTVAPYNDPEYKKQRPELGLKKDQILKIAGGLGLHPSLKGFAKLLDDSRLAIVQGVGYAQPNRSHFESMDIWHTCLQKPAGRNAGWLGRYLDATRRAGGDLPALHLGGEQQPLALKTQSVHVPSIHSPDKFKLELEGHDDVRRLAEAAASSGGEQGNELLSFVRESKSAALTSSQRVEKALGQYQTPVTYPTSDLATKMRTIAQLIDAGLGTRIYYVALDGFDTHSNQPAAHAGLLSQLGDAVQAFLADVTHHGHGERVTVMSFSEFGRRVKENASQGTDHGAAAPMFLAGAKVKPGLIGKHPSLTDLDDGDLKFHTDFRRVYAAVLEKWLGYSSKTIVGEGFPPADVLA